MVEENPYKSPESRQPSDLSQLPSEMEHFAVPRKCRRITCDFSYPKGYLDAKAKTYGHTDWRREDQLIIQTGPGDSEGTDSRWPDHTEYDLSEWTSFSQKGSRGIASHLDSAFYFRTVSISTIDSATYLLKENDGRTCTVRLILEQPPTTWRALPAALAGHFRGFLKRMFH